MSDRQKSHLQIGKFRLTGWPATIVGSIIMSVILTVVANAGIALVRWAIGAL
jgi:hypothetical protein